jgi:dTDP-4-dehydrorhamnose 3,5-epimerase
MYKIDKTGFTGLYVFHPQVFEDERGYFFESYNANVWKEVGVETQFVQDNESKSKYGTIRGLHYQIPPHGQSKLVRVTKGEVLDVVVDLRKEEETYGKYYSIVLSQKNKKQLLIPSGFAHGFSTLSETAVFNYKCDNLYNKLSEHGVNPLDPSLDIDWRIPKQDILLSEKDQQQALFGKHESYR